MQIRDLRLRANGDGASIRSMKLLASLFLASAMVIYPVSGGDSNASQGIEIVKGKTTARQIQKLLGTPYSTNPVAHGERWLYSYDTVSVQRIWYPGATAGLFLPPSLTFRYVFPSTITAKHHKRATIIFNKDKVVVNYWIKETPL